MFTFGASSAQQKKREKESESRRAKREFYTYRLFLERNKAKKLKIDEFGVFEQKCRITHRIRLP